MKSFLRGILLAVLVVTSAHAQTAPGFVPGQTLTAAQLNAAFASKNDYPASNSSFTPPGAGSPTTSSARASLLYYVEDFGAKGDGSTDDTAAINSCLLQAATINGACGLHGGKTYYYASNLFVPVGTSLKGQVPPARGLGGTTLAPYPILLGATSTTIQLAGTLKNLGVVRQGVNLFPTTAEQYWSNLTNYSGTGISIYHGPTGPANTAVIENVEIIGNNIAIDTNPANGANGGNTFFFHKITGDNINGIRVSGMHDFSWIQDVNFNPDSMSQLITTNPGQTFAIGNITSGAGTLVEITTSAANTLATGNNVIIYGVTGTVGNVVNATRSTITVIDSTHFLLQGVSFSGSYSSGGTVQFNYYQKTGYGLSIDTSEAPLFNNYSMFGYDQGVIIGDHAGSTKIEGLYVEDAGPDPDTTCLRLTGHAYATRISGGYGICWTEVTMNITSGDSTAGSGFPTVIDGWQQITTAQGFSSTAPTYTLTAGNLQIANSGMSFQQVSVASTAVELKLANDDAVGTTWVSGSDLTNVYQDGKKLGSANTATLSGPNVTLEVSSGGAKTVALSATGGTTPAIGTTLPFSAGAPLTVGTGTGSASFYSLVLNNAPSADHDQGGEIRFINGYASSPNKYMRLTSSSDLTVVNSAASATLFDLSDLGQLSLPQPPTTIGMTQNTLCITSAGAIQQQASNCTVSARRFKTGIEPLQHGLDWTMRLTPSTYTEKADGALKIGLIADDAGAIDKRLAAYNKDGSVQTLQPEAVLAVLTKAIQEQQGEIKALSAKLAHLSVHPKHVMAISHRR